MRTTELLAEAQKRALLFDQEIANVFKEKGEENSEYNSSKKVAIAILEFSNLIEEVYCRVIKRQTSKRPAPNKMLAELQRCNVDDELLHSFTKIKQFRNRIAHSETLERYVLSYFQKNLNGLDRIIKIKKRMSVILELARDDVEYAYVYVEAA